MTGILFVFDRAPDHEIIRGVVIELPREIGQVAVNAVDKTIELRPGHIEAVIESLDPGVATGAVVTEHRSKGIDPEIRLVLRWSAGRLPAPVVHRPADRIQAGHQG